MPGHILKNVFLKISPISRDVGTNFFIFNVSTLMLKLKCIYFENRKI